MTDATLTTLDIAIFEPAPGALDEPTAVFATVAPTGLNGPTMALPIVAGHGVHGPTMLLSIIATGALSETTQVLPIFAPSTPVDEATALLPIVETGVGMGELDGFLSEAFGRDEARRAAKAAKRARRRAWIRHLLKWTPKSK